MYNKDNNHSNHIKVHPTEQSKALQCESQKHKILLRWGACPKRLKIPGLAECATLLLTHIHQAAEESFSLSSTHKALLT